jgi:hypothetical protein
VYSFQGSATERHRAGSAESDRQTSLTLGIIMQFLRADQRPPQGVVRAGSHPMVVKASSNRASGVDLVTAHEDAGRIQAEDIRK